MEDEEQFEADRSDPEFIFKQLSLDVRAFYWHNIPRIQMPGHFEFYREYVAKNRPVIITDMMENWPAMQKWTNSYLKQKAGNAEVTVDVTPSGYGDHVVDDKYFVKPLEKKMKFGDFLDIIEGNKKSHGVYYVQHQNSNFTKEFSTLLQDVPPEIEEWGELIFGNPPDAVNLWIGTPNSVSTMHKDHYENFYFVVKGEKHFTLLPPTDLYFLHEGKYKAATYKYKHKGATEYSDDLEPEGDFEIVEDEPSYEVPWLAVDPEKPDCDKFPEAKSLKPIRCVVREGEMLYLPSMNYHRVAQGADKEGRTIAVNYWFDMEFDLKYCYYKMLENTIQDFKSRKNTSNNSANNMNTSSNTN
jgi:jumonji domain-containing protein 7